MKDALTWAVENWKDVSEDAKVNASKIKALLAKEDDKDADVAKAIELQSFIVDKSVWAFGGDGWAYDIGYGGLDHALASVRT